MISGYLAVQKGEKGKIARFFPHENVQELRFIFYDSPDKDDSIGVITAKGQTEMKYKDIGNVAVETFTELEQVIRSL